MVDLFVISGPMDSMKTELIEYMKKINKSNKIYFMDDASKYTYKKYDTYGRDFLFDKHERIRKSLYMNQILLEDFIPEDKRFAIINKSFADYMAYDNLQGLSSISEKDFLLFHKGKRKKTNRDYKKIFLVPPKVSHDAAKLFYKKIIENYFKLGYCDELIPVYGKSIDEKAMIIFEEIFSKELVVHL